MHGLVVLHLSGSVAVWPRVFQAFLVANAAARNCLLLQPLVAAANLGYQLRVAAAAAAVGQLHFHRYGVFQLGSSFCPA